MTIVTPAVRALRATPAFSAVAVLTMAVAIASTTAIFSVYDQLVAHPVTLPDPSSLVQIWITSSDRAIQAPAISVPRYDDLKDRIHAFSSMAASAPDSFTLTGKGDATQLNGLRVSPSFFPTLGIMPARGRNFSAAEDVVNGPAVCIISHELWLAVLGGRDSIVGETIELNGTAWEVVGVMPPRLTAPFGQVQVFAPRVFEVGGLTPAQIKIGATVASAIARLRTGATLAQARAEMSAADGGYKARNAGNIDARALMDPRTFVGSLVGGVAPTMYTLLGAVGCVLLIACTNVASLFLGRLLKRRKEIAVRMSLGASRGAIVRQFLAESLLFSAAAGALGATVAVWTLRALRPVLASQLPPNATLSLNWRALVVAAAVSLAAAILTGLVPALQASQPDLVGQLKDSSRGSSSGHGGRLRQVLIVAEVTLSVVLLVGAGLLVESFVKLTATETGIEAGGAASAFVGLPPARYPTPQQQSDFYERVIEQLAAQPGVGSAAASLATPLNGGIRTPFGVLGRPQPPIAERPLVTFDVVSENYFRLLRIPVAQGRTFSADDRLTSTLICTVNQAFAKQVFPGGSAIGQVLLFGINDRHVEIVGVTGDVKSVGVNAPAPAEVYFPLRQLAKPGMNVMGKTGSDPAMLQAAIRNAVAAVDRTQAVSFFATLESALAQSLGAQRLVATLTGLFAALALVLSLLGLYSMLAHLVSQRTPEIGIRMALGATPGQVVGMVMRSGLALVAVGLALGLGGAAAASRLIRQLLFGVGPLSAPIYLAVAAAFGLVAALACLAPSLRASRIDPLVAFRTE
ncbi:MAG TPA: ABC transporter permease [Vicinamibacterales bacterium]|jgi:predicted permease